MTAAPEAKPKNPTLAGILSGLIPGLGQLYCRQWAKGAAFLIGGVVLDGALGVSSGFMTLLQGVAAGAPPPDSLGILLRSLPLFALAVWSIVDAVRTAKGTLSSP
jgi:hypothetical protein